ncbi:MAG TPA: hypothetical protein VGA27_15360, partial [Candidatus Binatia bacterium]
MTKNLCALIVGAMLLPPAFNAQAQQAKRVHRIGVLSSSYTSSSSPNVQAFRQALRALGRVEGKDIE